jgi:MFS family permease
MSGVRAALSFPDFRRFVLGRFLATLAWQMLGVAVGWQVYSITRDPLDLGLVGLAQFLPFLALVLPGGQLADRVDRRLVIVTAYVIEALCAVVLLAFTLSGSSEVKWVFFAMALFGVGRAWWMPSGQAMTANLVSADVFPAAVAFNISLFQAAIIVGPAVGGLLYAFSEAQLQTSGALLVYAVCLTLLLLVVVLMWRVRLVRSSGGQRPVSMSEMFEGLRYVFSRRPILGAISFDLFAVLFGGATALLPIFAADILHVGPEGLGALRPASARASRGCCWRGDRLRSTPGAGCSAVSRRSVWRPLFSVCPSGSGCHSLHSS